ncbi:hypothetical protein OI69_13370 [Pectobacterium fontis]|uniref:Uncharacterized protein n=2 Tax=Pectobacterium fontis TaxID=2558042 RepID=A0A7V8IHP8_9GAMM|nr:hypothetical protein OI69_13370 [Pectobacterium fontis]
MEQKIATIERLEKELQGKIKLTRWVFLGGFSTTMSALLECYSDPYSNSLYSYSQVFLAVWCFGYGVALLYQQKKLEATSAILHLTARDKVDTEK